MAFNHRSNCDCPIGCCICGPSSDHEYFVMYNPIENNLVLQYQFGTCMFPEAFARSNGWTYLGFLADKPAKVGEIKSKVSSFKIGDRVAVYSCNIAFQSVRWTGTVEYIQETGTLEIKGDMHPDLPSSKIHPKQCRRLKPKCS